MAAESRPGGTGGWGAGVGTFRYAAAADTWQWSDGVFAIHGFSRGEVVPTMAVLLTHAHPGDRPRVDQLLKEGLRGGELFSGLYRIVAAAGELRWALIAGEGTFEAGAVTGIRGYLVDLTEPQARMRSQEAASAMRRAVAARATIEQAKGVLMLVYGLDAEAAFALLSWQSQHSNVKLRDLAERLVTVVAGDAQTSSVLRQRLDELVYGLSAGPSPVAAAERGEDELLAMDQEDRDGAVMLRLRGEIDMATGPRFDRALAEAIAATSPSGPLVVDMSAVQHLGSVGVALLTSYHRRCEISGIALRVVSGNGAVASVLSIVPTGLEVYRHLADALAPGTAAYQPPSPGDENAGHR